MLITLNIFQYFWCIPSATGSVFEPNRDLVVRDQKVLPEVRNRPVLIRDLCRHPTFQNIYRRELHRVPQCQGVSESQKVSECLRLSERLRKFQDLIIIRQNIIFVRVFCWDNAIAATEFFLHTSNEILRVVILRTQQSSKSPGFSILFE